MSSWFKKISQEQAKSRWTFSVEVEVWVPGNMDEEAERETAEQVLDTVLSKIPGDASFHTGIDSNVRFTRQFSPIKG